MTSSADPDLLASSEANCWLLQKSTDLDLHCLLRQGMSCSAKEGLNNFERDVKHQIIIIWQILMRGGKVPTTCAVTELSFMI